jgi:hypothetical protein
MAGTIKVAAQEPQKPVLASLGRTQFVPAEKRASLELDSEAARPRPVQLLSLLRMRLPFADRVTEQKGPFLTETRLPLVGVWNDRLELSCVHQRQNFRFMHPAYLHSTRYQAPLVNWGAPVPRSRENYGVTLSFHFGRRSSAPARATISGAAR